MSEEGIVLEPKVKKLFDRKGYTIKKKIGNGAFGHVYKAVNSEDVTCAVKVMDTRKMQKKFVEKYLPRELEMLQSIEHEHVLRVYDIFRAAGKIWIFMEFASNGTLTARCKGHSIPENEAKNWFKQITEALVYMHNRGLCHRDIKTDNVLFDKDDNAKLSDFGFARTVEDEDGIARSVCGTLPYYSPELARSTYRKSDYNAFLADTWAMGVLLYAMLTAKYAYAYPHGGNRAPASEFRNMIKAQFERKYNQRPLFQNLSSSAKDLIDHLLDPNPETRYTAKKILLHPWISRGSD